MIRIKMLTNTYDEYQGFLRRGDEKNVPDNTAKRWEKNHIAEIIEESSSTEETAEEKPMITFMAYEGEALEALDNKPTEEMEEEVITEDVEKSEKVDYSKLTRKELTDLAIARGIEVNRAIKTATIIEKLEA